MSKNKTPDYKLKANNDYASRHKLKRVWITEELATVLSDGTFAETQRESCNLLMDLLIKYGLVK